MLLHSPDNNNSQNSAAAPQILLSLVTIQWLFGDIVFAHVVFNMTFHKFFLLIWILKGTKTLKTNFLNKCFPQIRQYQQGVAAAVF